MKIEIISTVNIVSELMITGGEMIAWIYKLEEQDFNLVRLMVMVI